MPRVLIVSRGDWFCHLGKMWDFTNMASFAVSMPCKSLVRNIIGIIIVSLIISIKYQFKDC